MRVAMMHAFARHFAGVILCFFTTTLFSVGPIVPGQSLWCVTKLIGSSVDVIESQVCALDFDVSQIQALLCSKLEVLDSFVDIVESQADQIESKISLLGACQPTPITASTTLSIPGFYCLSATNTTGSITVQTNTNDVVVDLNGHRIQSVVIRQNDQVTFRNGTIVGSGMTGFGIDVQSGSRNITLQDINVQNAQIGINMSGVVGGLVQHCSMSLNFTGIELTNSAKIVMEDTVASCNKNAGFALITSTTNCFTDCKALSTGQGNTQTADATIFGFVSSNGYGNIFENCISNGTQGLSVVDFDSLVAGFALRGTEGCSKIIACEACNTITTTGFNVPYGILLENYFDVPLTLTGVPALPLPSDVINAVAWSPCGKYVAAGGGEGIVGVYEFNRVTGILSRVASASLAVYDDVVAIDWHPSGMYLAVVVDTYPIDTIKIYSFCTINNSLTLVATQNRQTNQIQDVAWHPSGKFLASVEGVSFSGTVYAYQFNAVAETLTLLGVGTSLASDPYEVDWSPDGNYVSIGETGFLEVYSFNQANAAPFSLNVQQSLPADTYFDVSVSWTPDGKYIAVGVVRSSGTHVNVYEFRPGTLTFQDDEFLGGGSAAQFISVDWSDDSRYLMVGHTSEIRFYEFDRSIPVLEQIQATSASTSNVRDVFWSPDGGLVAFGDSSSPFLGLYTALSFPSHNVIKNNVIYCTAGSDPLGIGISGSSIANMIIQNTAYSNPVDPFMVDTSYAFIPNVFNQLFGQGPTGLQNIAVGWNEPICTPDDLGLLSKQIKQKACDIISEIDVITGKITAFQTSLDITLPCAATPISAGPISAAGYYCLSADATGPFAINASNVVLDLNGRKITNGVTISGQDQIKLMNGTIEGTGGLDGVSASGSTNIIIDTVTIKNSLVGVHFVNVVGGTVENCSLTQNTTGLQLSQSSKITVDSTIASCNTNAGFDLITSTTNCFTDCKALSTGQGNTNVLNQTVFGFVASDGHGNIFERCIANSTQALSTTDFNSLVAGFALRGDEGCSKIIGCESSNATTSPSGVTIPYGILLEAQFSGLVSVTSINPGDGGFTESVSAIAWSPDGCYLAAGGTLSSTANNSLFIYTFNYVTQILTQIISVSPGVSPGASNSVFAIGWSPDGNYLAVGGIFTPTLGSFNDLVLYRFDRTAQTLTQVQSINVGGAASDTVRAVDWSPDGNYLAVGGVLTGNDLRLYRFDPVSQILTEVQSIGFGGADTVRGISWSPNGNYLAVGGALTGNDLRLYRFDRGAQTLTQVDSQIVGGTVFVVDWSLDGKYLAVGGNITGNDLFIYQFNSATQTVSQVVSVNPGGGSGLDFVLTVAWSPDGKYLAIGGFIYGGANEVLLLYVFDPGAGTLTQLAAINPDGGSAAESVQAIAWSPDGQYLTVGGAILGTTGNDLFMYRALTFPHANVINDNVVYCNSGASVPSGIGISGSSIANMIIQNTAYSNPLSPFMVDSSYVFVPNVFNQNFGDQPTLLQNIVMGDRQPICQPTDLVLLAKQIYYEVSQTSCSPTTLDSSDISGGTISLTVAGNYCLGEPVTADISITGTSVALNLNDNCLTGNIIISGDDVFLYNGNVVPPAVSAVNPTPGIDVLAGVQRAIIQDVVVDASTAPTIATTEGRTAMRIAGIDTQVLNCTLTAGPALNATTSNNGNAGGSGIVLRSAALRTLIRNCTISGNNGANGGTTSTFGNGGNGGHGIEVQSGSVALVEIDNCLIAATGLGGAPGTTNGTRTGGRGGDGVSIHQSASGVAVHNCIIRNAGLAGLSATQVLVTVIDLPSPTPDISVIDTADGKAVDDLVTISDNLSIIFGNFADTIKNPIVYNLNNRRATPGTDPANGNGGVLVSNPPDATAGGGNVIVNHIVNVFMDVLSS